MAGPPVQVWADNWLTYRVFCAMGTQWRVGMGGPTGLDYAALPVVMKFLRVPSKDQPEVFEGVCVMENAALKAMKSN